MGVHYNVILGLRNNYNPLHYRRAVIIANAITIALTIITIALTI